MKYRVLYKSARNMLCLAKATSIDISQEIGCRLVIQMVNNPEQTAKVVINNAFFNYAFYSLVSLDTKGHYKKKKTQYKNLIKNKQM